MTFNIFVKGVSPIRFPQPSEASEDVKARRRTKYKKQVKNRNYDEHVRIHGSNACNIYAFNSRLEYLGREVERAIITPRTVRQPRKPRNNIT